MDQDQNQSPAPTPAKSPNTKLVIIIVIVLVALGVIGFIFQKATSSVNQKIGEQMAENMIESATGGQANVDIDSDSMTVTTDEGTFTTGSDLPVDFPSDIPAYPGATAAYSGTSNINSEGTQFAVVLSSTDPYEKVADYYTTQLPAQGWDIESTQKISGTTILGAVKDNRTLSVAVASGDDATSITIAQSTEAE